jgi:hypothetical protein
VKELGDEYSIDKLRPVSYFNKLKNEEDIGFIAHEVEDIYPNLVDGDKDGDEYQALNYIGIIAVLVKEVKDLKKEVAELKASKN